MSEQEVKPPRLHLISCLYFVTGLLLIYLIFLRFYLPPSITYHVSSESIAVTPFSHTVYLYGFLFTVACLALSYWQRYHFISITAGLIGIYVETASLIIFFQEPRWGMIANNYGNVFYENAFAARVVSDLSYYPCKYCVILIGVIMLLRIFDYRPTTFRVTLLDLMLITIAVAVILGTRGIAMKAYGLS